MSESLFFPYRFASNALELEVTGLGIDGDAVEVARHVSAEQRSVSLAGRRQEWRRLRLGIAVSDPNEQLANVLPPGAPSDAVGVWLVLRNRYTRLREGVELVPREDGRWTGELELGSGDLFRTTEMQCCAVVRADLAGAPSGFAARRHERVAESPLWHVFTDTPPAMPGGALRNQWLDFATASSVELRNRADCVWFLDVSDAESPVLFLNEGVPDLRAALEVTQKTGRGARVRDALIHSILQGVLNQLAVFVLASNRSADRLDELGDWQRKMLLTLARTGHDATEELAAEKWLGAWNQRNGAEPHVVLQEVATAVQRHLSLRHSTEHLVRSVEKESADG